MPRPPRPGEAVDEADRPSGRQPEPTGAPERPARGLAVGTEAAAGPAGGADPHGAAAPDAAPRAAGVDTDPGVDPGTGFDTEVRRPAAPGPRGAASAGPRQLADRGWLVVGGLTALVAGLPLAVALGVLRHPRWYPLLDLAQTELRVRDVGTGHTPLVGLAGRFNAYGRQGSHLGPISFYALWPVYKLLGSSAWALQAAAATLNTLAVGTAIWIGRRRGGLPLAVAVAAGLAVLVRFYGAEWLTEAWNPYLPMLWWAVFLLAVWSVLDDDLPMLPVAVVAGTFCMQTHIPYLGLVGGVGAAVLLTGLVVLALRRADPRARRRILGWSLASAALLALLWAPPLVDELTNDPGNISLVRKSFAVTEDEPVGLGDAVSFWLGHMDLTTLLDPVSDGIATTEATDTALPGALLLTAWAAAALVTVGRWRRGRTDLRLARLHAVVAVALALGLVSISRVLGFLWYYLVLWAWGTTVLMAGAVVWTVLDVLGDRRRSVPALAGRAGLAVAVVAAGLATFQGAYAQVPGAVETRTLGGLAPVTVDALRSGRTADGEELPGTGESGRYLLEWGRDALSIGGQGYGMLLELERQGFDVGATDMNSTGAMPHRVMEPAEATAGIHYVVGRQDIEAWQATPGAVVIAAHDPRNPEQRARSEELRDRLIAGLEDGGLPEVAAMVDRSLFAVALHEQLPDHLVPVARELTDLGLPAAVIYTPPDVTNPAPAP